MDISEHSFALRKCAPIYAAVLWLVGFGFALMPFEGQEASSFYLAFMCVVFSGVFVVVGVRAYALVDFVRSPVMWLAGAFWGLALLSVVFSEMPFFSFVYFCFFSVFPLSVFMVAAQGGCTFFFKILGWGGAGIYLLLTVSAVVQYFFLPDMLFNGVVRWPLSNPNSLAGLYVLGFFGAFGWGVVALRRSHCVMGLGLAGLLFVAVLTTESRGALFSLLVMLVLFGGCTYGCMRIAWRRLAVLVGFGVLGLVMVSFFSVHDAGGVVERVGRTISGDYPVLWERGAIWESAWQIFMSYPLTGTGIGTFFLYYPEVRSTADSATAGLMAHNDPLQFAVEMGALAPLLFYAFILSAVWQSVRVLRVLERDDKRRVYVLAPFFALAAIVLHTHITFHFHVLSILMVVGVFVGFWFVQVQAVFGEKRDESEGPYVVWWRWVIAAPLLCILAVFSQYQAGEILINRSWTALATEDSDAFVADVNKAGKLTRNQNARVLVFAAQVPMGAMQLNAPFMDEDELEKMYVRTEGLLDDAARLNPRMASVFYYRAELIAFAGAFAGRGDKDARRALQEGYLKDALALDPLYLPSRVGLASVYARTGREDDAYTLLKDGLNWRYYNQNPSVFLDRIYATALAREDKDVLKAVEREKAFYFGATQ